MGTSRGQRSSRVRAAWVGWASRSVKSQTRGDPDANEHAHKIMKRSSRWLHMCHISGRIVCDRLVLSEREGETGREREWGRETEPLWLKQHFMHLTFKVIFNSRKDLYFKSYLNMMTVWHIMARSFGYGALLFRIHSVTNDILH